MAKTKVIDLSDGRKVKCRVVPILAYRGAMRKSTLNFPPPPMIEVSVQKGRRTEKVQAPHGSPEWDEYERSMAQVTNRREAFQEQFAYSYGVEAWSEDGEKWSSVPPKTWKMDADLADMLDLDLKDRDVRRAAFIMYDLLAGTRDHELVSDFIFGNELNPLLAEEVQAAEDGFQG